MKRVFLIVLFILLNFSLSEAAPFLVCDPQAGVTNYRLVGGAWVQMNVPAQADGSLKMDVVGAPVGNNSLTVAACRQDSVWGELCSSAVPFSFVRPASPTAPVGIKLVP